MERRMRTAHVLRILATIALLGVITPSYAFENLSTDWMSTTVGTGKPVVISQGVAYWPMDSSRDGLIQNLMITGPETFNVRLTAQDMTVESDERLTESWAYITEDEYKRFREIIDQPSKSTPREVALVNLAVKGTSLFLYFVVWLIGLVIFRYVFNRWWDEDVYQQTWPSVIVISVMVICTAWVLVATVQ